MKNVISIFILLLLTQMSFSQSQYVEVTGTIYDSSGNAVSYAPVMVNYPNATIIFGADANGVYYDSTLLNAGQTLQVSAFDCTGDTIGGSIQTVIQGQSTYVEDFTICDSSSTPPCNGFISQSVNGTTAQLTALANTQAQYQYAWTVNGSHVSGGQTINYTFPGQGVYSVCVTASSALCTFSVCDSVLINANPPGNLSIAGNVLKNGTFAQSGVAFLFRVDSINLNSSILTATDFSTIDSGMYMFNGHTDGTYRVLTWLDPLDPDHLNYFPTWYGDQVAWSSASDIVISGSSSFQNDINLVPVPAASVGVGNISGSVVEGPNKAFGPGDPIKDVIVMLRDANGSEMEYALTDANGEFSFTNIALGDYQIILEIPNESMNPHLVSLNTNQSSSDVDFQYDTLGVQLVLGFEEVLKANTNVFPNPAMNTLNVVISESEIDGFTLTVFDLQGKERMRKAYETRNAQMEITELKGGVYFLNISTDKGQITKRFVKQ